MIALPLKAMAPKVARARPAASGFSCGARTGAIDSEDMGASVPRGLAVATRVARGDVALDRRIARTPDELAGSEVLVRILDHVDLMAQCLQPLHRCRVHAAFDVDLQPLVEAPARRVAGGLRVL